MPKSLVKKDTAKKSKGAPKKAERKPAAVKTAVKTPTLKIAPVKHKNAAPIKSRNYFYANGKRKTSIATVRLYSDGKGIITVNNRAFENYFPVFTDQDKILSPLRLTNTQKLFDISARVHGGGIHSQAEAIRHGVSKALLAYNPELRGVVKPAGFLTRDSRIKERKKYGLKRARRAPQWQKR